MNWLRRKGNLPWFVDIPTMAVVSIPLFYLLLAAYGFLAVKTGKCQIFPYAVSGASMEETIHQPVSAGKVSCGALVWLARSGVRRLNSILLFWTPDGKVTVKRVSEMRVVEGRKQYRFEPDNAGITGEGSGWGTYDWVGDEDIVGTVFAIWTLQRSLRTSSSRGRFVNRTTFEFGPRQIYWNRDRSAAIFPDSGSFHLKYIDGASRSWAGKFDKWESRDVITYNKSYDGTKWRLWVESGIEEKVTYRMGLSCGAVYSATTLGFEGDVRSKTSVGQRLIVDGRRVRITKVGLVQMGPEGASTQVTFEPPLNPEPSLMSTWKLLD